MSSSRIVFTLIIALTVAAPAAATDAEPAAAGQPSHMLDGVQVGPDPPLGPSAPARARQLKLDGLQTIDFDDVVAPCGFINTVALTNEYEALGVVFQGPGGNDGGAILDECGNFGVTGHSPPNFLAFNTGSMLADGGIPQGPETLSFVPHVDSVRINAGGPGAGTMLLECFDALSASLGADTVVGASALQPLEVAAAGIASCVLSFTGPIAVFDDLQYNQVTVPNPVAIAANTDMTPIEHDYLAQALDDLGYTPVTVTSTAQATAAGAPALVVYSSAWDGAGLSQSDLVAWVNGGLGLIQVGDWHDYFPNDWVGRLPTPTIVAITLKDGGHPVVHGCSPSWPGRGFYYYGWPDGAIGFTLGSMNETDLAMLEAPGYGPHDYGIAALDRDIGCGRSGRAVYFGLNLWGPAAGPNESRLLDQALGWITTGLLFEDGFESGDTSAWSSTVP